MKRSFNIPVKIFKYLFVLYSIVFWVYIIIDDYVFIEKYWSTHWLEYIGGWFIYYLLYFMVLSIYFWLATLIVFIFLYLLKKLGVTNKTENKNAL